MRKRNLRFIGAGLLAFAVTLSGCGDDSPDMRFFSVTVGVVTNSGDLSALQFDLTGVDGVWRGHDGDVDCELLVDVALHQENDRGSGLLRAALVDLTGFATPGALMTCTFASLRPLTEADFSVAVVDAALADLTAPSPAVLMTVLDVSPTPEKTPLPTASTTSTMAPVFPFTNYDVTVGVTSGGGLLSALQFDVRYNGDGDWLGGAGSVDCSTHPQVTIASYNNRGNGWYSAAMIDLTGFDAVGPITTCRFISADPVEAMSFIVTVIGAGTPEAAPPDPLPQMAVTDIRVVKNVPTTRP